MELPHLACQPWDMKHQPWIPLKQPELPTLGGGNSNIFSFHPWGRFSPILTCAYFFRWVGEKPSTRNNLQLNPRWNPYKPYVAFSLSSSSTLASWGRESFTRGRVKWPFKVGWEILCIQVDAIWVLCVVVVVVLLLLLLLLLLLFFLLLFFFFFFLLLLLLLLLFSGSSDSLDFLGGTGCLSGMDGTQKKAGVLSTFF